MTHIEARNRLKKIELIEDFESLLDMCILSDEDKTILRMVYLQHKTMDCVADELGFSGKTIKNRHKEALRKMIKAIDRKNERCA